MITIIKDIKPHYGFMEAINQLDSYRDTVRGSLEDYISSASKDDNIIFLVKENNTIKGIFSFLILPIEKYAESLWMLSKDEEAYEEMLEYMHEHYKDFECYFVYNPKNEILNCLLRKENAEFSPIQMEMKYEGNKKKPGIHKVLHLTEKYTMQYKALHDKDLYWTAEKIIEDGKFITYVSKNEEEITGYADIDPSDEENHIMDILVSPEHRNQGYGKSLMLKIINESYPKKVCLEVDSDNYPARHLYESLGFKYMENKDIITVFLKL